MGLNVFQDARVLHDIISSSLHDTANIQMRSWHHYKAKGTQSVKQRPHICLLHHKRLLSDLHVRCAVNCAVTPLGFYGRAFYSREVGRWSLL